MAATSTARQRKKQVDMDIQLRVQRLIEDHGPQTEKPLTLRVYGTMIKGFCVVNNERARSLYFDSERVVLMFARQPFTEDHKIRLPAAKRQRMEAALTLDLDLARVEACEAFDWTRAPLEQGALLQLGAGFSQEVLPSIELAELKMPQLLDPSACEVSHDQKPEGWVPRFQAEEGNKEGKDRLEVTDAQDCSQLVVSDMALVWVKIRTTNNLWLMAKAQKSSSTAPHILTHTHSFLFIFIIHNLISPTSTQN